MHQSLRSLLYFTGYARPRACCGLWSGCDVEKCWPTAPEILTLDHGVNRFSASAPAPGHWCKVQCQENWPLSGAWYLWRQLLSGGTLFIKHFLLKISFGIYHASWLSCQLNACQFGTSLVWNETLAQSAILFTSPNTADVSTSSHAGYRWVTMGAGRTLVQRREAVTQVMDL